MRRPTNIPLLFAMAFCWLTMRPVLAEAHFIPQSAANSSYFLDDAGALWAWGDNTSGQLGDGKRTSRARPVRIEAPGVTRWTAAAAGKGLLAVDQAGRLWGWSLGERLRPEPFSLFTNRWRAVAICGSSPLACSLNEQGEAWLWRFSTGPGFAIGVESLRSPAGVGRWVAVAAGGTHLVLLADSGRVFVFGLSRLGALGPAGSLEPVEQFLEVPPPDSRRRWLQVAAGPEQCFAQASDGEWYFWGGRLHPAAGSGYDLSPQPVPRLLRRPDGVAAWRQVVAGLHHVYLVSAEGFTFALGANTYGQRAAPSLDSAVVAYDDKPVRVIPVFPTAQRIREIGSGAFHGLSLGEDGLLYTWGLNMRGELGRSVDGADWRPRPLRGASPPFSPTAPPLVQLAFAARSTNLVAPFLAGGSSVVARYEIRRLAGPDIIVPFTFTLAGERVLPGFPEDRLQLRLDTNEYALPLGAQFHLRAGAEQLAVALEGVVPRIPRLPSVNTPFVANAALQATAPPWVEWEESDRVPVRLDIPSLWSAPPWARLEATNTFVGYAGETNTLRLFTGDFDDWVTEWQLYVQTAPKEFELLAARHYRTGVPGLTDETLVDWVPAFPQQPSFRIVLRDNAGSVVTNELSIRLDVRERARFIVEWFETPPVVTLPGKVAIQITDRRPDLPVGDVTVQLSGNGGGLVSRVPERSGNLFTFTFTNSDVPDFTGEVLFGKTPQAVRLQYALPMRRVATRNGVPWVTMETVWPIAGEGDAPGAIVVRRHGGDLTRGLTVGLRPQALPAGLVPPPRVSAAPAAAAEGDYEPLSNVIFAPGEVEKLVIIQALDDLRVEGYEGLYLAAVATGNVRVAGDPALVILQDNDLDRALPTLALVPPPPARHSALRPLLLRPIAGPPGVSVHRLEVFLDDMLVSTSSTLVPPLPVGAWRMRVRLVDQLGRENWSDSFPVEFYPELTLLGRVNLGDGSDLWRVQALPEFQPLRLEASEDLGAWQPVQPWFITPTNRTLEVRLPASDTRFLRLVPTVP